MINKKVLLIGLIFVVISMILTGCGKKDESKKVVDIIVNYGETSIIENKLELTVKSNKIVKNIKPTNTTGYYTYINAGENKKIVDICVDLKNISDDAIVLKDLFETKMYVGDEEVEVMYIMENTAKNNMLSNAHEIELKADTTREMHFATKVDKELVDKETIVKLVMKTDKNEYTYVVNIVIGDEKVESEGSTININYKGVPIKQNELVSVEDICEFTIKKYEFADTIVPSNPTGFYMYLPSEDGKLYIDLQVTVKNLHDSAVKQDQLPGTVTVFHGDKDVYTTRKVIEVSNGGNLNTYTSSNEIEPLDTEEYHIIASVPAEVKDSKEPLWVTFNVDGKKYIFNIR